MKITVNKYNELTPSIFGLEDFEKNEEETFGSYILIADNFLYVMDNNKWTAKFRIYESINRTIYFESKNQDLHLGKMYPNGFRVLKIKNFFIGLGKTQPTLVLEVFDEILQEFEDATRLGNLLKDLNINFIINK